MSFFDRLLAFNSSHYRLLEENSAFAKSLPNGAMVLDAGAGECPYWNLFTHAKYESADIQAGGSMHGKQHTYACDLNNLPVEDGRFEAVIFNQVHDVHGTDASAQGTQPGDENRWQGLVYRPAVL